jgi:hypothetical protein
MNDNELREKISNIILTKVPNKDNSYDMKSSIDAILDLITAERAKWELEAKTVISLFGKPRCEQLHHDKKYQHAATQNCPVEALITELNNLKEKL